MDSMYTFKMSFSKFFAFLCFYFILPSFFFSEVLAAPKNSNETGGFICGTVMYQIYNRNSAGSSTTNYGLYYYESVYDPITRTNRLELVEIPGALDDLNHLNYLGAGGRIRVNAVAYNITDGFIYFMDQESGKIFRLGRTPNVSNPVNESDYNYRVEYVGMPVGDSSTNTYLNDGGGYIAGDIDVDGKFYFSSRNTYKIYYVDLSLHDLSSSNLPLNTLRAVNALKREDGSDYYNYPNSGHYLADFVIDPIDGNLYSWAYFYSYPYSQLVKVDLTNKTVERVGSLTSGNYRFNQGAGANYWKYGYFYAYGFDTNNPSSVQSTLFRVDPETGVATHVSDGTETNQNDGCSCAYSIELQHQTIEGPICLEQDTVITVDFTVFNRTRNDLQNVPFEMSLPGGAVFASNIYESKTQNPDGSFNYVEPSWMASGSNNLVGSSFADNTNAMINPLPYVADLTFKVDILIPSTYSGNEISLQGVLNMNNHPAFDHAVSDNILTPELDDPSVITIHHPADVYAGDDQVISQGVLNTTPFNATAAGVDPMSYHWSPSEGLNFPTFLTPIPNPSDDTEYVLEVEDGNGCLSRDTVQVRVVASEVKVKIEADGDEIPSCAITKTLRGIAEGENLEMSWKVLNGSGTILDETLFDKVSSDSDTLEALVLEGRYRFVARDLVSGNSDSTEITIIQAPSMNVDAGDDFSISRHVLNTRSINPQLGNVDLSSSTVVWSPSTGLDDTGIINPVPNPSTTTTYTLTVRDRFNCVVSDVVTITVDETEVDADIVEGSAITIGACDSELRVHGTFSGTDANAVWQVATRQSGSIQAGSLQEDKLVDPHTSSVIVSPGTYWLIAQDVYGNRDTAEIVVNQAADLPSVDAGDDFYISEYISNTRAFDVSSTGEGLTYSWVPASSLDDATIMRPTANPSVETLYTVTATDQYGCSVEDTVRVRIDATETTADVNTDVNLIGDCETEGVLTGIANGTNVTYHWREKGTTDTLSTNSTESFAPGIYEFVVEDEYGNVAIGEAEVRKDIAPVAEAGDDITISAYGFNTIALDGTASGVETSIQWSPSDQLAFPNSEDPIPLTPSAGTTGPLTFTMTVTDKYGCVATDVVDVHIDNTQVGADAGSDIEIGFCDTSLPSVTGTPFGTEATGIWTVKDGYKGQVQGSGNTVQVVARGNEYVDGLGVTQTSEGIYIYTVTDKYGNKDSAQVQVVKAVEPVADAGGDFKITSAYPNIIPIHATASGESPLSYSWTPAASLDDASVLEPVPNPSVDTEYTLTVTDSYGCTATDAVLIEVTNDELTGKIKEGDSILIGHCYADTTLHVILGQGSSSGDLFSDDPNDYTFEWSVFSGGPLPSDLVGSTDVHIADEMVPGEYEVLITHKSTLTEKRLSVVIERDVEPLVSAGEDKDISKFVDNINITLDGSVSGAEPLTYSWTPDDGTLNFTNILNPIPNPSQSMKDAQSQFTYTLSAVDKYGCVASDDVLVNIDDRESNYEIDVDVEIVGDCDESTTVLIGYAKYEQIYDGLVVDTRWELVYPDRGEIVEDYPDSKELISGGYVETDSVRVRDGEYMFVVEDRYGRLVKLQEPVKINREAKPTIYMPDPFTISKHVDNLQAIDVRIQTTGSNLVGGYAWSPGTTLLDDYAIEDPVPNAHGNTDFTQDTTFVLSITDTYGCVKEDSIRIYLDTTQPETEILNGVDSVGSCAPSNERIVLEGKFSGSNAVAWWEDMNGVVLANGADLTVDVLSSSDYRFIAEDMWGQTDTTEWTVHVVASPSIISIPDMTISGYVLNNRPLEPELELTGVKTPIAYEWSVLGSYREETFDLNSLNPVPNPVISATDHPYYQDYELTVTDGYGCLAASTVRVHVDFREIEKPEIEEAENGIITIGNCETDYVLRGTYTELLDEHGDSMIDEAVWEPVPTYSNYLDLSSVNQEVNGNQVTVSISLNLPEGDKIADLGYYMFVVRDRYGHMKYDSVQVYRDTTTVIAHGGDDFTISGHFANSTLSFEDHGASYVPVDGQVTWEPSSLVRFIDGAYYPQPEDGVSERVFEVRVTDAYGCDSTDQIRVYFDQDEIAIDLPNTDSIGACEEVVYTPEIEYENKVGAYRWLYWPAGDDVSSDGELLKESDSRPISDYELTLGGDDERDESGVYVLELTDIYGNVIDDTLVFREFAMPEVFIDPDTLIVSYSIDNEEAFEVFVDAEEPRYEWSPDLGLSQNDIREPVANFLGVIDYQLKVIDKFGCEAIDSVNFQRINLPPVAEDDEAYTVTGDTVMICVLDNDMDPEDKLDASSVVIEKQPLYGVAWVDGGCIYYITHEEFAREDELRYSVCDDEPLDVQCDQADVRIYIEPQELGSHNIITPNGDGVNDYFKIKGIGAYPQNRLRVYNRWGNLVYEQENYRNTFNGYANSLTVGQDFRLPKGTYFYIFEYPETEGKNNITGYIYIAE
ncbi:hypothetical protein AUTU_08290 [Aureibacter tunicatorum]|nr:hypothetical protein AUTU_08290 [Aureibacter tunicatorum]